MRRDTQRFSGLVEVQQRAYTINQKSIMAFTEETSMKKLPATLIFLICVQAMAQNESTTFGIDVIGLAADDQSALRLIEQYDEAALITRMAGAKIIPA